MAKRLPKRNRKGQFIKGSAHGRKSTRRRRRTIGVRTGAFGRKVRRVRVARHPVLVNPRRKRRASAKRRFAYVSNPRRRRSYRRNPSASFSSIFSKPTLKNVGFAVVGLAGTPMLAGFLNQYLPAAVSGNKWAGYAVKAGSAWALSFGVGKIAGREAERSVLIGGLAYVALGAITDFFPTLIGGTAPAPSVSRYLRSTGKQPLLAEYMTGSRGSITAGTPTRLSPAGRF